MINPVLGMFKALGSRGMYLGTAGVLWAPNATCFPLGKVCKYVENGREDSVYFFARVALEGPPEATW